MSLIDRAFGALQVLKEERLAIGLLLAHSFSIGIFISYYLAYANGAFMGLFEATDLPLTYVLSGVTGFVASAVFARYQKRVPYGRLAMGTLAAIGVVVAAFMVGVWIDPTNKPLIFGLFLGLIPVLGLIGLQFGGMIMQLFDLRQGKRLYGVIASGEVVSSMIWFFTIPVILRLGLVPQGQQWMLLGIALAGLGLGMVFQVALIRKFPAAFSRLPQGGKGAAALAVAPPKRKRLALPKLQFDRPYFAWVFFLMLFSTLGRVFVDYSFMDAAKATFAGSLTAFFGTFFGLLKVIELVTNTFFASRLLSKYGIKLGLLILPTLLAVFALVAIVGHWTVGLEVVFLGMAMNKLFDKTVRTSLELPSFKTLYQPLAEAEKFKLQTQTEGQAGQFGVFLAGGLLMLFIAVFPQFKMMEATYFLGAILLGWLFIARRTVAAYRQTVIDKINGLQTLPTHTAPTAVLQTPTALGLSPDLAQLLADSPPSELPYLTAKHLPQLASPNAWLAWLARYAPQHQGAALLPQLGPTTLGLACFQALQSAPLDPVALVSRYRQLSTAPTRDHRDHLTLLQLIALSRKTTDLHDWQFQLTQHPQPAVRWVALDALHATGFQVATPDQRRLVKSLLQQALRHYLYLVATRLDTATYTDSAWQQALDDSLADAHRAVFAHLALLYDRATVFQIAHHLAQGAAQEALAIEMADILLKEDFKEMVLPFLDRISDAERLKLLHWLAPQPRFSFTQRLQHVALYDYTHGDTWLRYQALQAIAPDAPQTLRAHLHHPEWPLREAAWQGLYQHHEATYYRLLALQAPTDDQPPMPQTPYAERYTALHRHIPHLPQTLRTLLAQCRPHSGQHIHPWPDNPELAWSPATWHTLLDTLPVLAQALSHTPMPDEIPQPDTPIAAMPPLL